MSDNLLQSGGTERGQAQTNEQAIQANSFGGLNTSANPLNLPYEDSPLMQNVVTDLSGAIVKRKGTKVLSRDPSSTFRAVMLMPISTSFGYNLVCVKSGTNLDIYELNNDRAIKVVSKANVWDSLAATVRPGWFYTSELQPRLIICTGVNKPVQVKFAEAQARSTGGTTLFFPDVPDFLFANSANTVLWVNRQRYESGFTTSIVGGNMTVTLSTAINAGDVVDVTFITWQWWAESYQWQGDRFFASQTRFNAVPTDQVVKIPEKITSDLSPAETRVRDWQIILWKEGRSNAGTYTRVVTANPTGADEYWFSDGTRYVPSATNTLNPSPYFVTFGTTSGTTPTSVYFTRRRFLYFNSGTFTTSGNIDVFIDGQIVPRYTTPNGSRPVYPSYGLINQNNNLITNTTDKAERIEWEADRLGVAALSTVDIVNKELKHIGSNATQSYNAFADGSYVPAHGLGLFADYLNGAYPSAVTLYQGRLVFSGFSHRPTLVLFSNVNDSTTSGQYFNFYQITDDLLAQQATSPLDIELPKRGSDDRVVSVIEWQRSLFVLTRRATYRISPGQNGVLSASSSTVTFLSSTGCVNGNSVVQTETSVHYLGDNGLYDLNPRVEDGEFKVEERSIKIRAKFGITQSPQYEDLAWVSYNPQEKYIYVGYPALGNTETSVYLYVLDTSRSSWTEFTTQGYFRVFDAKPLTDRMLGNSFVAVCTTQQEDSNSLPQERGLAKNLIFLKFAAEKYVDYYDIRLRNDVNEVYPSLQLPDIQFTVGSEWEQTFKWNYESIGQFRGFVPVPITDIVDCQLNTLYNGVFTETALGTDWAKKPGNAFYLLKRQSPGTVLSFVWKPPSGYRNSQGLTHVVVWVNRVQTDDWFLEGFGGVNDKYVRLPVSVPQGALVEWGYVYTSYYESPMFFNQQLGNYKRMKHVYAFFDNQEGQDTYRSFDAIDGQPYEQITDTYKQRVDANISMLYSAEQQGYNASDTYGFKDIYWDDAVFDFDSSAEQSFRYSTFKEPIQGVGYSYQLAVWSTDEAYWKLCGYQVEVKQKGKRNIGRF